MELKNIYGEVDPMKPPKILDKIVDVVLKYRPETKQKPPHRRKISTKRLSDA
jgi:hypothetical protein